MSVEKHCKCEIPVSRRRSPDTDFTLHMSFFSAGEDLCWAQPFLCTLPPPQSMATLGAACMQNKEVLKMPHILSFLDMKSWIDISSENAILTFTHYSVWFVWIIQAEDGLSRCSLGPLWSQLWCVGRPSSLTSLLSTTTPLEPSHLAPW